VNVALLEHDGDGASHVLADLPGAVRIPVVDLPDAPLRLRKIGDRPGRMPGALIALLRGNYDIAHAFTPQDAVVAIAWSRLTGRPAVYTQREPLTRASVADRRLKLATLRLALERPALVLAPDQAVADSVLRWMAVRVRVVSGAEHAALYAELHR
jgi:Glycosyltransferase Family 4